MFSPSLRHVSVIVLALFSVFAPASQVVAGPVLYSAGTDGNLYTLNPATGDATPPTGVLLHNNTGNGFSITGLAYDASTRTLYGATASGSNSPNTLVTINPTTGVVSQVGIGTQFTAGGTMSDIVYVPNNGIIYGWGQGSGNGGLYTIDTSTGAATLVKADASTGGGLAVNTAGSLYVTPDGTNSLFVINDKGTGTTSFVANLSGFGTGNIDALAFNGSTLLGLRQATDSTTHLVTIDTTGATAGHVTDLGRSVGGLEALAVDAPEPSTLALTGICLLSLGVYYRRQIAAS